MQPNNFLRWSESSFTDPQGDLSWRRRQRTVWGAETAPIEWSKRPDDGKAKP